MASERRLLLGVLLILALVVPVGAWALDRSRQASTDPSGRAPTVTLRAEATATVQTYPPGRTVPSLALTTLDGRKLDLAAYRGRPLLLNFWATWCAPCVREFPLLRRALDQRGSDGLAIVGVLVNDNPDKARGFVRAHGGTWPVAPDEGGRAVGALGVFGLPETVFVRPDGTMSSRVLGELTQARLNAELARIIPR